MKQKNAFVTGSSRGIGRSIAIALAQKDYHVFINCKSSVTELKNVWREINTLTPGKATMVIGDVGNPSDVEKIFSTIYETCCSLDVLINNAGTSHIGLLSDLSVDEWNQVLHTNLSSVFYCCKKTIPFMVSQKSGKILNISSIWGNCGASCEVAYSASKAGIEGFTKALGKELAPSNIQVNALSLGVMDTAMNSCFDTAEVAQLKEEIPSGRFGSPEEAAEMALHILESPAYLTGQIIRMDGGFI